MARVTRESILTGIVRTLEIASYDTLEFERRYVAWKETGVDIKTAFPDLHHNTLMFITHGTTPEEWEQHMGQT